MRAEQIEKAAPVQYLVGGDIFTCPELNVPEEQLATALKKQFRHAEESIRGIQKQNRLPGYILKQGIVYKVFPDNKDVKKITGEEAKQIKRKFSA